LTGDEGAETREGERIRDREKWRGEEAVQWRKPVRF
jgi:hypothetical protein